MVRVVVKCEKASFYRIRMLAGMLEPGMPVATMIRDDIQNVTHISLAQGVAQVYQGLISTEVGVNVVIIDDIVFVIGVGSKDGVEIQGVDSQRIQVIQALLDALQIPAVKYHGKGRVWSRWFPPRKSFGSKTTYFEFLRLWIIGRITVGEAIRENLVKHRIVYPCRGLVIGQNLKISKIQWVIQAGACSGIPPDSFCTFQDKAIMNHRLLNLQFTLPPLPWMMLINRLHGDECLLAIRKMTEVNSQDRSIPHHPQAYIDSFSQLGVQL
jgi:hypothetical protein